MVKKNKKIKNKEKVHKKKKHSIKKVSKKNSGADLSLKRKKTRNHKVENKKITAKPANLEKRRITFKKRKTKIKKIGLESKPKSAMIKNRHLEQPRYSLNKYFEFYNELRGLILKSSPAERSKIIKKIVKLGKIKLVIVSGIFLDKENMDPNTADLLVVGDNVNRRKFRTFIKSLEAEVGKELKFAVMDKEEFDYRLAMFDRFVRVLLEGPHEKLIDKIGL